CSNSPRTWKPSVPATWVVLQRRSVCVCWLLSGFMILEELSFAAGRRGSGPSVSLALWRMNRRRNPKSEGRNPKEFRNPKSEHRYPLPFFSDLGFRVSEFERSGFLQPAPARPPALLSDSSNCSLALSQTTGR